MFPYSRIRLGVALFVLGVCLLIPSTSQAQKTGPKRKVHIILAGLTDDPNTGKSVEYNINQMKDLLESGLADHHIGNVRVLKGPAASAKNMLETVDRIGVGPGDTLFMYFHGHGAYDPAFKVGDSSGGHFLAIPSGDLLRKNLWDRMRARKAKLTVLVTETCNVRGTVNPYFSGAKPVSRPRGPRDIPVLASLLLNHQGAIDVNACAKDEFSWNFPVGRGGSYFTDTFVDVIEEAPFSSPGRVSWTQFLKVVSDRASRIYTSVRRDVLATPERFNAELVNQFRGQVDQRVAIFHMSFVGGPTDTSVVRTDPILPVKGEVLSVGAGLTLPGKLTDALPRGLVRPGCVSKTYQVRLEAAQMYVIDLQSTMMDTFLCLEDSTGARLLEDDDSGGMLNARIHFRPVTSGTYRIVATTFRPATGDFTFRVQKEGGSSGAASKFGTAGLRVTGSLGRDDPRDSVRLESHHKAYIVELQAGKSYVMELQSTDVDPYLRVEDTLGREVARDDDSGGGLNARLEFHPSMSGPFRVIVTTYAPAVGSFTLVVREN